MLLAALFISTPTIMAQELKQLTLEDVTPGGATYRFAENIYNLQWWGDVCIKPDIDTLYAVQPATGATSVLTTRTEVNKALEGLQAGPIPHFYNVSFPWSDKKQMLITLPTGYVIYSLDKQTVLSTRIAKEKMGDRDYCIATGNVAFTINNNLYVNDKAVTNEPEGVECGKSVHRNEFGITKGTFWSPKGNLLAFYRMDERMVAQYPLVDITTPMAEVNNIRYPMAGNTSHVVSVGIYRPADGHTLYLQTGDPTDRYFTNICWAPDEQSIYLIELNRDQNHAKLCQYNAETGELMATLLEEQAPDYVEPQQPITFLPWDSSQFIYQSQRDGFNHLYLYNTQGKLLKQLTSGAWMVQDLVGFHTAQKEIIIASTEYSPLQSNLFRVNLKSGKRVAIGTVTEGVHRAQLSASGTYVIDTYSSPTVPRNIDIVNVLKGKSINLLTAANPFEGFRMPVIETGIIKAADGVTDLHYRLTKPADFDPNKQYPAIIYVYGGPHAQMVTGGWLNGLRGWDMYMANKGYILFSVDNRGSGNRGKAFESATFRQLGIEEGKDQVKGAEFLQSLPYVDGTRIGVHGWSFGGHMTTALMLRYPHLFKVGVAGGPVIDWGYYEVMYGERYMDTPQSNPEGYKQTNLKNLAGNLKGHLLIIHDDHDDTCVPQHTLSFMKACVDARTYPDLFIYPGHKHNVLGRDRVHLHEKITRYFEDNL